MARRSGTLVIFYLGLVFARGQVGLQVGPFQMGPFQMGPRVQVGLQMGFQVGLQAAFQMGPQVGLRMEPRSEPQ